MDKVTKLFKIGFSMKCFRAEFLQFCSTDFKISLAGGRVGTRHQVQAFQRLSYDFHVKILIFSRSPTSEVSCTFFSSDNNLVPCHLW